MRGGTRTPSEVLRRRQCFVPRHHHRRPPARLTSPLNLEQGTRQAQRHFKTARYENGGRALSPQSERVYPAHSSCLLFPAPPSPCPATKWVGRPQHRRSVSPPPVYIWLNTYSDPTPLLPTSPMGLGGPTGSQHWLYALLKPPVAGPYHWVMLQLSGMIIPSARHFSAFVYNSRRLLPDATAVRAW